jgi:surface protein
MPILSNNNKILSNNNTSGTWRRPEDWLPMPMGITSANQIFVGLYAVIENDDNFCAFRFTTSTGQYQVDWGDGTTTLHNSNTNAEKQYDFATYDTGNTTLTSRGYKQAMITVTPVSGNLLTCNFQQRFVTVPAQNQAYSTGFLDCILSMPSANTGASIVFGGTTVRHSYVERFDIKTIGNVTQLLNIFFFCSNLKSVPLFDTQNVTNMQAMFSQSGIETIPLFNTSNVTSMNSMFNISTFLKEIPLLDTSNVTDFSRFLRLTQVKNIPLLDTSEALNMSEFLASTLIQSVPLLDTSKATNMSAMLNGCSSLNSIPALSTVAITSDFTTFAINSNSLNRCQMVFQRTVSFTNCQLSRDAIVEIFNNLAVVVSATITITGNWGVTALSAADLLIATSKGWTVTQ